MSYVANVLLWTMIDETSAIANVQQYLRSKNELELVQLDQFARGAKGIQADWFGRAYNHFDIPGFLTCVRAQKWEFPEAVAVLIQDEHDELPTMYRVDGPLVLSPAHQGDGAAEMAAIEDNVARQLRFDANGRPHLDGEESGGVE